MNPSWAALPRDQHAPAASIVQRRFHALRSINVSAHLYHDRGGTIVRGPGMTKTRRVPLILALAAVLALCGAGHGARAQSYPTKPIHLLVPFAAGGIPHLLARALGQRPSQKSGQPRVSGNKAR